MNRHAAPGRKHHAISPRAASRCGISASRVAARRPHHDIRVLLRRCDPTRLERLRFLMDTTNKDRAMPIGAEIVVLSNQAIDLGPGPGVEVRVEEVPADPRYFPFHLRRLLHERAGEYDLYIATENDVGELSADTLSAIVLDLDFV